MKYNFGFKRQYCRWWRMKRQLRQLRSIEYVLREHIQECRDSNSLTQTN